MSARPITHGHQHPAANDPGIGQGRNGFHDPKLNRDALLGLALVLVPWALGVIAIVVLRGFA